MTLKTKIQHKNGLRNWPIWPIPGFSPTYPLFPFAKTWFSQDECNSNSDRAQSNETWYLPSLLHIFTFYSSHSSLVLVSLTFYRGNWHGPSQAAMYRLLTSYLRLKIGDTRANEYFVPTSAPRLTLIGHAEAESGRSSALPPNLISSRCFEAILRNMWSEDATASILRYFPFLSFLSVWPNSHREMRFYAIPLLRKLGFLHYELNCSNSNWSLRWGAPNFKVRVPMKSESSVIVLLIVFIDNAPGECWSMQLFRFSTSVPFLRIRRWNGSQPTTTALFALASILLSNFINSM